MTVQERPDLTEALRELGREDMAEDEVALHCTRALMSVVEVCQDRLAEERLRGVAFIALREDGTALTVVGGDVFGASAKLSRAVRGAL